MLEARFFDGEKELHMFKTEENWNFVRTSKKDGDYLEKSYRMDAAFPGQELIVRQYVDYDEDGQAYIARTCLCGIGGM